jgi:hypothetical protein
LPSVLSRATVRARLRERALEHINHAPLLDQGKYDVSRPSRSDVGQGQSRNPKATRAIGVTVYPY